MKTAYFATLLVLSILTLVQSAMAAATPMRKDVIDDASVDLSSTDPSDPAQSSDGFSVKRAFLDEVLNKWQLQCVDGRTGSGTPYPVAQGVTLIDQGAIMRQCLVWFTCPPSGQKTPRVNRSQLAANLQPGWDWCNNHCMCNQVLDPTRHYNYNFGCPAAAGSKYQGQWVQGAVGSSWASSKRDEDGSVDIGDGLKMSTSFGPVRE